MNSHSTCRLSERESARMRLWAHWLASWREGLDIQDLLFLIPNVIGVFALVFLSLLIAFGMADWAFSVSARLSPGLALLITGSVLFCSAFFSFWRGASILRAARREWLAGAAGLAWRGEFLRLEVVCARFAEARAISCAASIGKPKASHGAPAQPSRKARRI